MTNQRKGRPPVYAEKGIPRPIPISATQWTHLSSLGMLPTSAVRRIIEAHCAVSVHPKFIITAGDTQDGHIVHTQSPRFVAKIKASGYYGASGPLVWKPSTIVDIEWLDPEPVQAVIDQLTALVLAELRGE